MNPRSRRLLMAGATTLALALAVSPLSQAATKTKPKAKAVSVTRLAKLATAPVVRLGFFANVTHASALIGQQERFFEKYVGADGTKIEYTLFNAGPSAIEAMKGGALDVSYIGPSPSISGYVTTNGALLRIVSGATSGGAQLVVKPGITSLDDLNGKLIATPQLGNTQDVAIRAYLKSKGFTTNAAGRRNVLIQPTDSALTLTLFKNGQIDGAWLPEPWASRLVLEAGAKVLVDEQDSWPNGDFVTTDIIAKADFLKRYPGTVRSILRANLDANAFAKGHPAAAQSDVQLQLLKWTTRKLPDNVIQRAWGNIRLTADPLSSTLNKSYEDATGLGLLPIYKVNALKGIFDIRLLNSVLRFRKSSAYKVGPLGVA